MWALYMWSLFVNHAPIFGWYMERLVVKNGHQNTCVTYNDIICARNVNIILGSIVNTLGRISMTILRERKISFVISYKGTIPYARCSSKAK
jgi:hypothetical protein